MSTFNRQPGIPDDHPATLLAVAFERWAAEAPAGERTPVLHVDVLDSIGRQHGGVDLTERQADRLAAELASVDFATHSASAISSYLFRDWGLLDTTAQPAAQVKITDVEHGQRDDHDPQESPITYRVPIAPDRLADLTAFLTESLFAVTATRDLAARALYQEGQTVRVVAPAGATPFSGLGETGVITFVHVTRPGIDDPPDLPITYSFDVRLNTPDHRVLNLRVDELQPVHAPGT